MNCNSSPLFPHNYLPILGIHSRQRLVALECESNRCFLTVCIVHHLKRECPFLRRFLRDIWSNTVLFNTMIFHCSGISVWDFPEIISWKMSLWLCYSIYTSFSLCVCVCVCLFVIVCCF